MGVARDCLDELQHLSADRSGRRRDDILRRVTDLFLITAERQSDADRAVFADVMGRLAPDAEREAQIELAYRLADAPHAPATLVRWLANCDIAVARPLLERSQALDQTDLIDIARGGSLAHGDAISRRASLSAAVTDRLLEHADDVMLTQLAANPDAALSQAGYAILAERASANPELRHALVEREGTPPAIRSRLRRPGSAGAVAGRHDQADPEALLAWEAEFQGDARAADVFAAGETQRDAPSRVHEASLAEAAREGDLERAIAALSALTGLARPMIETCLLAAETPALVVLCKAHELASPTFSALLQLRLAQGAISTKGIASAMRRYETMDAHMAQRIMRFLKVRLASADTTAAKAG